MRQAYLEIALIYIHSSGIAMIKEGSSIEILGGALSVCCNISYRLMRQAYLEIALIYILSSGIAMIKEGSSIEILSGALSVL